MAMSNKVMIDIGKVLQFVKARGFFAGFERFSVDNYDMNNAMAVITAIGRTRSPHFVIDDENRFAYVNFIKWCHGDSTMKALDPMTGEEIQGNLKRGIYIAGNTGSGKSWCLEVMLAYAQVWGFKIRFEEDKDARPLFWAINRADDICHEYLNQGETLYMGNRLNVLQQLLEYRGDRGDQLTLITSNLRISSETLKRDYGDRVQSRLVEMCNYFEIKGKDRRKGI